MISLYEFLALDPQERWQYFERAAAEMKIPVHLIEKDFWVTFLLEQLFNLGQIGSALTFKGGTSLSKVFGLIYRFSEDIDISIEKSFFGFEGDRLPEKALSRKQRERLLGELRNKCQTYVKGDLREALSERIQKNLPSSVEWKIKLDAEDPDSQSLLFDYQTGAIGASRYVRPVIKLEFGARAEHWPVEQHQITSYLHQSTVGLLSQWSFKIRVLSPSRTFWEQATILHMYANFPHGKPIPIRQSRHYYDLYCLINSQVRDDALRQLKLLSDVCDHKSIYFGSAAAKYDQAKSGNLKLIPSSEVMDQMQADYREMGQMIFGEAVEWRLIVDVLSQFEKSMRLG